MKPLKTFFITSLMVLTTAMVTTIAFAGSDCPAYPKSQWIPQAKFKQQLIQQGYQIKKFEVDDNCYEVHGKNKQGETVDVNFDTKTGEIVKIEINTTTAFAGSDCPAYPKSQWIPQAKFKQQLIQQGYQIKKFEVDDNCYEVHGKNKQGETVDVNFDTKTGEIVKIEIDYLN